VICQRPADGLSPGLLGEIMRRKTRRAIKRGEVLQWGMFE
jgi:sialic acid synthase SpsE